MTEQASRAHGAATTDANKLTASAREETGGTATGESFGFFRERKICARAGGESYAKGARRVERGVCGLFVCERTDGRVLRIVFENE